jgi:AcrR family transcriptional regulator
MGRPAKFDSEQMLDAAAGLVARGGPSRATVAAIAEQLEAPSGSIYHRFESRDLLLARLWIRTARRAQEGFVATLDGPDLADAARQAALHIPRWARSHLDEATVLLLYRREDLAAHCQANWAPRCRASTTTSPPLCGGSRDDAMGALPAGTSRPSPSPWSTFPTPRRVAICSPASHRRLPLTTWSCARAKRRCWRTGNEPGRQRRQVELRAPWRASNRGGCETLRSPNRPRPVVNHRRAGCG